MIEFAARVPHLTTVAPGALVLEGGVVVGAAVAVAVTVGFEVETAVVGGICALVA